MKKKKEEHIHNHKLFTSKWLIHESEIEVLKVGYHKKLIIKTKLTCFFFFLSNNYDRELLYIHRPTSKYVPIHSADMFSSSDMYTNQVIKLCHMSRPIPCTRLSYMPKWPTKLPQEQLMIWVESSVTYSFRSKDILSSSKLTTHSTLSTHI